ncbi:MAG: hypothetical protein KDA75_06370 [Planctomycetaceae bacterium]|nr:hypothetical protein [Planctomycetaceae bacterium]
MTAPSRPSDSVACNTLSRPTRRSALAILARGAACAGLYGCAPAIISSDDTAPHLEFRLKFSASVRQEPFTGRVYVFLAPGNPQPLSDGENWFNPQPLLAKDVVDLRPGEEVILSPDDVDTLRDPFDWSTVDCRGYTAQSLMRFNPWGRKVTSGAGNAFSPAVVVQENEPPTVLTCDTLLADSPVMESRECRLFSVPSTLLSEFYGRDVDVQGMVLVPAGYFEHPERRYPVLFSVPGFGGSAADAFRRSPLRESNTLGVEFIRVTLDPSCPLGHHAFVDSANNGPWGTALVQEFLPALAAEYRTIDAPRGRLLTGHSSGGWSSLWLQVNWPDVFGGVWSLAPDPVDFRDFQQINIYRPGENMYVDPQGQRRPLARAADRVLLWYDSFCHREDVLGPGGQLHSFEACFSPHGEDGSPQRLWNRETGDIDPAVAAAWTAFDIRLVLQDRWNQLAPKLAGKLRIHMGTLDTFYLDGATVLLKEALRELGSDAVVELHAGADHGSFLTREMRERVAQEMAETVQSG